jgi:serine/threonine protein kinase
MTTMPISSLVILTGTLGTNHLTFELSCNFEAGTYMIREGLFSVLHYLHYLYLISIFNKSSAIEMLCKSPLCRHFDTHLYRGRRCIQQFELQNEIYIGKFSRVFEALDTVSGQYLALKLYSKRKLTRLNRSVRASIDLLATFARIIFVMPPTTTRIKLDCFSLFRRQVQREVLIQAKVQHKGVIDLYAAFEVRR